jgi:hypothetical protein
LYTVIPTQSRISSDSLKNCSGYVPFVQQTNQTTSLCCLTTDERDVNGSSSIAARRPPTSSHRWRVSRVEKNRLLRRHVLERRFHCFYHWLFLVSLLLCTTTSRIKSTPSSHLPPPHLSSLQTSPQKYYNIDIIANISNIR